MRLFQNLLTLGVVTLFSIQSHAAISKNEFQEIPEAVLDLYRPIYKEQGLKLRLNKLWEDDTMNAYMSRFGNTVRLTLFGGLARHPLMTAEAFVIVACREIGHVIAGEPLRLSGSNKISVSGQTDYFTTAQCAKRYFDYLIEEGRIPNREIPQTIKMGCDLTQNTSRANFLCRLSALAGLEISNVLADIASKKVSLSTPDLSVVSKTLKGFPSYQCRLDTYFAGALCAKAPRFDDEFDPEIDFCTRKDGYEYGSRPLCWYAPKK